MYTSPSWTFLFQTAVQLNYRNFTMNQNPRIKIYVCRNISIYGRRCQIEGVRKRKPRVFVLRHRLPDMENVKGCTRAFDLDCERSLEASRVAIQGCARERAIIEWSPVSRASASLFPVARWRFELVELSSYAIPHGNHSKKVRQWFRKPG